MSSVGFGPMYDVMRNVGTLCLWAFYREVQVVGGEDVPKDGPVIVCSTHHNTIMDVGALSGHFPHRRKLHYWAKSGLYKNAISRFILTNSGNIKVDRRTKNNQDLFAGTFEVMKAGEAVALFPEGGSYTEPQLHEMKSGAAWSALEYAKHLALNSTANKDGEVKTKVTIVPASVVYTDKSRYRSSAVLQFGPCLFVDAYTSEFLSATDKNDGLARSAVTKLTKDIGAAISNMTVNAPDWTTWHAAKAAREMLWPKAGAVPLQHLVRISTHLVGLLTERDGSLNGAQQTRELLLRQQALNLLAMTDTETVHKLVSLLSAQGQPASMPSPLTALSILGGQSFAFALRLPIYVLFVAVHIPVYVISNAVARAFAGHEEESMASVKSLVGFGVSLCTYAIVGFASMAICLFTPPGLFIAVGVLYLLIDLHVAFIDDAYSRFKLLVATWHLFIASMLPGTRQLSTSDPQVSFAIDALKEAPAIQFTLKRAARSAKVARPACARLMGAVLRNYAETKWALKEFGNEVQKVGSEEQKEALEYLREQGAGAGAGEKPKEQ